MSEEMRKKADLESDEIEEAETAEDTDELETVEIEQAAAIDDPELRVLDLENQLAECQEKAAEYLDGWQRARAEFANARKRLEKERAEAYRNAAVEYAASLLPIIDDFDRAAASVPDHIEEDSWFEGIVLVNRKLHAILTSMNVERIEALGRPFDPNCHQALSLTEAEGQESGIVVEELQTGYKLGDRIIRPALVNVAA